MMIPIFVLVLNSAPSQSYSFSRGDLIEIPEGHAYALRARQTRHAGPQLAADADPIAGLGRGGADARGSTQSVGRGRKGTSLTNHLRTTLRADPIQAALSGHMQFFVTTFGADAIPTRT
jgi:hypothetical protein